MNKLFIRFQPQFIKFILQVIFNGFDVMVGNLFDCLNFAGIFQGKIFIDLPQRIKRLFADTFGGKSPDEWTEYYDERYVLCSEPDAACGDYRCYFKQIDREISKPDRPLGFEPAVIKHHLHRYPLVTIFQLAQLDSLTAEHVGEGVDPVAVKFLVYYASRRDPVDDGAYLFDARQDTVARRVIHGDGQDPPRCWILEPFQANRLAKCGQCVPRFTL